MFREEVAAYYRKRGYAIKENVKVRSPDGTVYAVDMVAQSALGNLLIAFEDEGGFEGPEMNAVRRMAREIGATPVVAAKQIPDGLRKRAAGAGVVLLDQDTIQAPEIEDAVQEVAHEPEYPPWPGSGKDADPDEPVPWPRAIERGRMEPRDVDSVVADLSQEVAQKRREKSTDPGIWQFPRQGADPAPEKGDAQATATPSQAQGSQFQWLPQEDAQDVAQPDSDEMRQRREEALARRAQERARTTTPSTPAATVRATPVWIYIAMAAVFGATGAGVLYALLRLFG